MFKLTDEEKTTPAGKATTEKTLQKDGSEAKTAAAATAADSKPKEGTVYLTVMI